MEMKYDHCPCEEIGKDGTERHSDDVAGIVTNNLARAGIFIASELEQPYSYPVCSNHLDNYRNIPYLTLEEKKES